MELFETVKEKVISSVKWTALIEVVSKAASPLIFIVLARLLTPTDFGVVATAMIAISFSQIFCEAGLSQALVQTSEPLEKAANVVFWLNLVFGVLVYQILFFTAPLAADFFHSPASLSVIRVLGLQIVINTLTSVQQALLVRDMGFRQLFWVKLATVFVPGLFSIPLALSGFGVWALVAGALAGSILNLILLWARSSWRPRWEFDRLMASKLFRFGFWVIVEGLAFWVLVWGDNLIVARYLGSRDLGVYSLAWTISVIIFSSVSAPIYSISYPTFARLQDDMQTLKSTFLKANRLLISLSLPLGTGLLLVGPQIADVFFGAKWQGLGLVLSLIGFMQGMMWLVALNDEVYRAIGRPDVNTKLRFASIIFFLPAYLISAPFGLMVFTITRVGVSLLSIPIRAYLCVRILGVSPLYLWDNGKTIILSTIVMAATVIIAQHLFTAFKVDLSAVLPLVVQITIGLVTYTSILWLFDRPYVLSLKELIKRAASA